MTFDVGSFFIGLTVGAVAMIAAEFSMVRALWAREDRNEAQWQARIVNQTVELAQLNRAIRKRNRRVARLTESLRRMDDETSLMGQGREDAQRHRTTAGPGGAGDPAAHEDDRPEHDCNEA